MTNRPESGDSNFAWDDFAAKVNTELRDNLGNFINRSLKFVSQFFDRVIPEPSVPVADLRGVTEHQKFIEQVEQGIVEYLQLLEKVKIKDALHELMKLSFLGNKYAQDQKVCSFGHNHSTTNPNLQPWEKLKNGDKAACATVVFVLANFVKIIVPLIEPYMPTLADKILDQLKSPHDKISVLYY